MSKEYDFVYAEPFLSKNYGIRVEWGIRNFGFGLFHLGFHAGKFTVDSECMDEKFVEELLIEIAPKLSKLLLDYEHNGKETLK
jgi:hypothetical protein